MGISSGSGEAGGGGVSWLKSTVPTGGRGVLSAGVDGVTPVEVGVGSSVAGSAAQDADSTSKVSKSMSAIVLTIFLQYFSFILG